VIIVAQAFLPVAKLTQTRMSVLLILPGLVGQNSGIIKYEVRVKRNVEWGRRRYSDARARRLSRTLKGKEERLKYGLPT